MFRRFYVQKIFVQKVLYSEGPMFRRFYVQKVLYSEGPMFRRLYVQKKIVQKVLYSEGSMFRRSYIQIYSEDFNQHSEQPQTRSDHRRIVPAIQGYDTTVYLVIFACSNIREFLILGLFTKFRIREFSFFFRSDIIIVIFARFWNSNFAKIKTTRILPDLHYI